MIDRFCLTLTALTQKKPVLYGPTPAGCIRFLTLDRESLPIHWYYNTIFSHDRTLKEWRDVAASWRSSGLPTKYQRPLRLDSTSNPFFETHSAAAALEMLLEKELRLRHLVRKCVAKLRARVAARNCVGADADLFTTEPIPPAAMVKVQVRGRTYCFHRFTAARMILNSLHHASYGIALPQEPKNPYTNMPWSLSQKIALTEQIGRLSWSIHKPIPPLLIAWRNCDYDMGLYFKQNARLLRIKAAQTFFSNLNDADALDIYMETVEDLYDDFLDDEKVQNGSSLVCRLLREQLLPVHFKKEWKTVVIGAWTYKNYDFVVGFDSYEDLLEAFEALHKRSKAWWALQPRTLLTRLRPSPLEEVARELEIE